jgi:uncharacterized membrane protein YfhO
MYKNPRAAPRSFIVANTMVLPDQEHALQALAGKAFTYCSFATITTIDATPAPRSQATGCVGSASITEYTPNHVRIRAQTPVDGLLVLTDSNYPGWRVFVDGVEQPVETADSIFRGVRLNAGQHEVDFRFMPLRVAVGGRISFVTLLIALSLIAIGLRRSRSGQHRTGRAGRSAPETR